MLPISENRPFSSSNDVAQQNPPSSTAQERRPQSPGVSGSLLHRTEANSTSTTASLPQQVAPSLRQSSGVALTEPDHVGPISLTSPQATSDLLIDFLQKASNEGVLEQMPTEAQPAVKALRSAAAEQPSSLTTSYLNDLLAKSFEAFTQYCSYPLLKTVTTLFLQSAWPDIELIGIENVPKEGSFIIAAAPHQSHMDTLALSLALQPAVQDREGDPRIRPAASSHLYGLQAKPDDSFLKRCYMPLVGGVVRQILYTVGAIPIDRDNSYVARSRLMSVDQELKKEGRESIMLLVFPEGARHRDSTVAKFKSGLFDLAKQSDVPVMPVVMENTREAWDPRTPDGLFTAWFKGVTARFSDQSPKIKIHALPTLRVGEATDEANRVFTKNDAKAYLRNETSRITGWPKMDAYLGSHGAGPVPGSSATLRSVSSRTAQSSEVPGDAATVVSNSKAGSGSNSSAVVGKLKVS